MGIVLCCTIVVWYHSTRRTRQKAIVIGDLMGIIIIKPDSRYSIENRSSGSLPLKFKITRLDVSSKGVFNGPVTFSVSLHHKDRQEDHMLNIIR